MSKKFTPTITAWETALKDALSKQSKSGVEGMTRVEVCAALAKHGYSRNQTIALMHQLAAEGRLMPSKRGFKQKCMDGVTRTHFRTIYSVKGKA